MNSTELLNNASATISAREFAILRHGLRYLTAAFDHGVGDLSAASIDSTELMALDYKLHNIIQAAKAHTQEKAE